MRFALLFLFSFLLSFAVDGQDRVGINDIQLNTTQGDQPAFEFFIPDTDADAVQDAWNKFHKSYKVKPKQDKNQRNYYFSDNAQIAALSENSIDIYARMYETDGGVRFACAFDLGGVFISSRKTPDKYGKAKLLLNRFYAEIAMTAILLEIESESARLESLNSEYQTVNGELQGFELKADEYRTAVKNHEKAFATVSGDLEKNTNELAQNQNTFKAKQKELTDINKAGIVADLTGYTDDLDKTKLETTRIEKDIATKEAMIESLRAEINLLNNELSTKREDEVDLQNQITGIENRLVELNLEEKEETLDLLGKEIKNMESAESTLKSKQNEHRRSMNENNSSLIEIEQAIKLSEETKSLLEGRIAKQEAKIRELLELKGNY
ncbi:MAG: hypothetical protein GY751_20980 [Bacteroidetes bacterium]|nr:hypothetical protein [Bacteroidota bacterium]